MWKKIYPNDFWPSYSCSRTWPASEMSPRYKFLTGPPTCTVSSPEKNTQMQRSKACYILNPHMLRSAKQALFTSEMETKKLLFPLKGSKPLLFWGSRARTGARSVRPSSQPVRNIKANSLYSLSIYMMFLGFLARLHEVHRAIAVTPVVHVPVPVCVPVPVPVPVRVTLALKFSRSPYLDNHSSESIHTWTIDTL